MHSHSACLFISLYHFIAQSVHHTFFAKLQLCRVVSMHSTSFVNFIMHNVSSNVRSHKIESKGNPIPDHRSSMRRSILNHAPRIEHFMSDHITSMRHAYCIGYKRSTFYYFNSYQILCINKLHAFRKHNYISRGFNGKNFKDLNTLKIPFENILKSQSMCSLA